MEAILKRLDDLISLEENFLPKFPEGSSQHSLLRNRIQALRTSRKLLSGETMNREDLEFALPRIESILHKMSKARDKHEPGSQTYKRLDPTVRDMTVVRDAIEKAIGE